MATMTRMIRPAPMALATALVLAGALACAAQARHPLDPPAPAALAGAPAPEADPAESAWPHRIDAADETILVYQPQIESWTDGRLAARAAVSIEKPSTPQPSYGVIWLSARTEVDKATRLVTLEDVHITKGRFPTERDAAAPRWPRSAGISPARRTRSRSTASRRACASSRTPRGRRRCRSRTIRRGSS
jgi:hypothetical protein